MKSEGVAFVLVNFGGLYSSIAYVLQQSNSKRHILFSFFLHSKLLLCCDTATRTVRNIVLQL